MVISPRVLEKIGAYQERAVSALGLACRRMRISDSQLFQDFEVANPMPTYCLRKKRSTPMCSCLRQTSVVY
ncbi:MAG: hypothetical protein JO062_06615 [Bryobacterales bacterium]|nr:hypothetical protein [Bryobacterales bacterium]